MPTPFYHLLLVAPPWAFFIAKSCLIHIISLPTPFFKNTLSYHKYCLPPSFTIIILMFPVVQMVSHIQVSLFADDHNSLGCRQAFIGQHWECCFCWCYWSWQPSRPWFGRALNHSLHPCMIFILLIDLILMKSFNVWFSPTTEYIFAKLMVLATFSDSNPPLALKWCSLQ